MRTTWVLYKTALTFQLVFKESTLCICLLCIHRQLEHRLVCLSLYYGQQRHLERHIVLIHPVGLAVCFPLKTMVPYKSHSHLGAWCLCPFLIVSWLWLRTWSSELLGPGWKLIYFPISFGLGKWGQTGWKLGQKCMSSVVCCLCCPREAPQLTGHCCASSLCGGSIECLCSAWHLNSRACPPLFFQLLHLKWPCEPGSSPACSLLPSVSRL